MLLCINQRFFRTEILILVFYICRLSSGCKNCQVIPRENYIAVNDGIGVIPKCCGLNEGLEPNPDFGSRCVNQNRSATSFYPFIITNNETDAWNVSVDGMKIVVGNPSCSKYPLQPNENKEDKYYVFNNGSLFTPEPSPRWRDLNLFCLEYFLNDDSSEEILPFVCFDGSNDNASSRGKYYVYAGGLIISVPFLLCTFLVYALIPDLNDLHGKCLCCHVICLIFAFISLASVQLLGERLLDAICVAAAFMIQFFFLAAFCWLSVMCFNTWINVTQHLESEQPKEQQCRYFIYYSIFSWLIPLAFFTVTLISDSFPAIPSWYIKPQIGIKSCWFKSDESEFPYFYGPIAVLICANVFFFIMTARELSINEKQANEKVDIIDNPDRFDFIVSYKVRWRKYLQVFYRCLTLFLVMGVNWIIEVISWSVGGHWTIWVVFDVINSLQGVIIFCIFVLKKPVRNLVKKKLQQWNNNTKSEEEELHNITSNNRSFV